MLKNLENAIDVVRKGNPYACYGKYTRNLSNELILDAGIVCQGKELADKLAAAQIITPGFRIKCFGWIGEKIFIALIENQLPPIPQNTESDVEFMILADHGKAFQKFRAEVKKIIASAQL